VKIPESRAKETRGWEVPGDRNDDPKADSWVEGSWMNKHDGTYYLQYAAPGTQFKTYGDGMLDHCSLNN
jgi:xylan 1,4-beta-xylosidase